MTFGNNIILLAVAYQQLFQDKNEWAYVKCKKIDQPAHSHKLSSIFYPPLILRVQGQQNRGVGEADPTFAVIFSLLIAFLVFRKELPKHSDILTSYHTCLILWTNPFRYLLVCIKLLDEWQTVIRRGVWSGSTLFAQACLYQYLQYKRYFFWIINVNKSLLFNSPTLKQKQYRLG